MQNTLMKTNEELEELAQHGDHSFPIQYYVDELSEAEEHDVPLHWHGELEFYMVWEGSSGIQIDADSFTLHAGEAIFINKNVVHSYTLPDGERTSIAPNILFSPRMIGAQDSAVYVKYVMPLLEQSGMSYLVLTPQVPWQKQLLDLLVRIFAILQRYGQEGVYGRKTMPEYSVDAGDGIGFELDVTNGLQQIWTLLYRHCYNGETGGRLPDQKTKIRILKMLEYVQQHYAENLTLEEIAESASVSRSEAGRCFQLYTRTSPMEYVIRYRINRAKELLAHSEKTVDQIAGECGFNSAGYFGKLFRRREGMTPLEYRRKVR